MIEAFTYPDYAAYDETFTNRVAAEKNRLLGRIAAGDISHMELLCLPSDDAPLENYEIINTALYQLEQTRQITKVYEVTDQQNVIIGYTLADNHSSSI